MRTIYKYDFAFAGRKKFEIPKGSILRHVGGDPNGRPALWFEVDTDQPMEHRDFECVGTGWNLDDTTIEGLTYVGTAVIPSFVWHIYEDKII